jgi:hypothetical protein
VGEVGFSQFLSLLGVFATMTALREHAQQLIISEAALCAASQLVNNFNQQIKNIENILRNST